MVFKRILLIDPLKTEELDIVIPVRNTILRCLEYNDIIVTSYLCCVQFVYIYGWRIQWRIPMLLWLRDGMTVCPLSSFLPIAQPAIEMIMSWPAETPGFPHWLLPPGNLFDVCTISGWLWSQGRHIHWSQELHSLASPLLSGSSINNLITPRDTALSRCKKSIKNSLSPLELWILRSNQHSAKEGYYYNSILWEGTVLFLQDNWSSELSLDQQIILTWSFLVRLLCKQSLLKYLITVGDVHTDLIRRPVSIIGSI